MVLTYNLSVCEAEAEGSRMKQPGLHLGDTEKTTTTKANVICFNNL